jgi:hypothetical protein
MIFALVARPEAFERALQSNASESTVDIDGRGMSKCIALSARAIFWRIILECLISVGRKLLTTEHLPSLNLFKKYFTPTSVVEVIRALRDEGGSTIHGDSLGRFLWSETASMLLRFASAFDAVSSKDLPTSGL